MIESAAAEQPNLENANSKKHQMKYEEAKAQLDKLSSREVQAFNNVHTAWLRAKMQCRKGEDPTRASVRREGVGVSMTTVCKYFPIVLGLQQ